jgi:Nucleotide modification associated domain 2
MMEREIRYYVYKMTTDNGGAPCIVDGVLTLAICKPGIRSTAEKGDWLFGFGGQDLGTP